MSSGINSTHAGFRPESRSQFNAHKGVIDRPARFTDTRWTRVGYLGDANIFFSRSSLLRPFWDLRTTYTLTFGKHRRIFSNKVRPNSLVTPVRSTTRFAYHSHRDILGDCGLLEKQTATRSSFPPGEST